MFYLVKEQSLIANMEEHKVDTPRYEWKKLIDQAWKITKPVWGKS